MQIHIITAKNRTDNGNCQYFSVALAVHHLFDGIDHFLVAAVNSRSDDERVDVIGSAAADIYAKRRIRTGNVLSHIFDIRLTKPHQIICIHHAHSPLQKR